MKKRLYMIVICAFVTVMLTPGLMLAADKPIRLKYAHIGPPMVQEPMHATALTFKYMLEKETAGKYQVDIYPAGTLGKELDLMEAVKNNVIHIHAASMGGLHRIFPPAVLAFAPYVFINEEVAAEVIEGPFGQKLLDAFTEKTGIKGLAFNHIYIYLGISNNVRPIRKPSDMKGVKFRGMDTLQVKMFQALGGSAVPVSLSEVYTALQTGVVNGQTNPALLVRALKWYEVQKYMSLTNSQYGYQWMVCNKPWYDKLSKEDRNALRAAIKASTLAGEGTGLIQENLALEEIKKKGMQVDVLSPAEIEEFRKIAKPACLDWLRTQMDPQWVDEFLTTIENAEIKLGYR
jgi:tripartite ATP-independent transporter DctP family solute receptor